MITSVSSCNKKGQKMPMTPTPMLSNGASYGFGIIGRVAPRDDASCMSAPARRGEVAAKPIGANFSSLLRRVIAGS